ncbi:MAG: cupredoxin family copper-binding protein [Patescibacteria group bacterium]
MQRIHISPLMLAFAVVLLIGGGCSQKGSPISGAPSKPTEKVIGQNQITIGHFVFEPEVITVKVGEKVTWLHDDNVTHTVISTGLFESQTLKRGEGFDFVFSQPGEYRYYCSIHPSMTGKVIVK